MCKFLLDSTPCLLLGDFNAVRYPQERQGGDLSWPPHKENFNDCCNNAGILDLRQTGEFLTWSKGSGTRFLARKLEKALVNQKWLTEF